MSTLIRVTLAVLLSISTAFSSGCRESEDAQASREVNLAIWGNFLGPELAKKFESDTKIKLNISNYASNEELLAKVQAGAGGIDVAVPSDYMVSIMMKLNLLHPLDKTHIPNHALVRTELLNQSFDPQNTYSLPYTWATAGIAVHRDLFKGDIKSWADIFENPELAGRLSLLDDVREVTAAALKYHGFSVNSTDQKALSLAEKTLLKIKPRVKMFRSDTVDSLLRKEVAVAQSFSTDALQAAARSNGKIEYILPEEGGTRSIDTMVILKNAKNKENAHRLINFLLSPEVNVSFVKTMWGGPVLKSTREKLPAEMKNNSALFPSPSKIKKFEALRDIGEGTRLYDELWTRVKTD